MNHHEAKSVLEILVQASLAARERVRGKDVVNVIATASILRSLALNDHDFALLLATAVARISDLEETRHER